MRAAPQEITFGALILAAGASRRMGLSKPLLQWGGGSLLEHAVSLWRDAGATQTAVVFDPREPAVERELDRIGVSNRIPSPEADRGMMASLRAAAGWPGWAPELCAHAIMLCDQPGIAPDTLGALVAFAAYRPGWICQPEHEGRHGHPVILPARVFRELARTRVRTLRDFIRARGAIRAFLACGDAGILADLDRPEDYRRATNQDPRHLAA
jgi:molybdenum cofactor cytidylyltransferase